MLIHFHEKWLTIDQKQLYVEKNQPKICSMKTMMQPNFYLIKNHKFSHRSSSFFFKFLINLHSSYSLSIFFSSFLRIILFVSVTLFSCVLQLMFSFLCSAQVLRNFYRLYIGQCETRKENRRRAKCVFVHRFFFWVS